MLFLVLLLTFQAVSAWAAVPMDMIDKRLGSMVIFLPRILVLFFFILILESTDYLARAAFLLGPLE